MLPCNGCAYREGIAGSAHSRCVFAWPSGDAMPKGNPHGIRMGWYLFPFNYDPTWGPNECPNRAETREASKVVPSNPVADLISLLGGRF